MKNTSFIELSKSALTKNFKYLNKRIGKDARLCSVIKGNAYGHGIENFLPLAEMCGVSYFAVADAIEAERAYNVKSPKSELMIMSSIDKDELEWAIENDISFYVFEFDRITNAVETAKKLKKKARIHIEFETGFHRTGFEEEEFEELVNLVNENREHLHIEGLCTHYAGAESISNFVRVNEQISRFNRYSKWFEKQGITAKYRHTACSAATLIYPETHMDMVRVGIATYGYWPGNECRMYNLLSDDTHFRVDPLHRILTWKTRVMSLKKVPPGKFIGYGNTYMTTRNEQFAVIPVGYFHGFNRSLSNLGHVLIRNKKAPVVGLVNMNMTMVNVTNIKNVKIGDEAVMIGRQGSQVITVASFADSSKILNYEMLTRLPTEIPRYIVK